MSVQAELQAPPGEGRPSPRLLAEELSSGVGNREAQGPKRKGGIPSTELLLPFCPDVASCGADVAVGCVWGPGLKPPLRPAAPILGSIMRREPRDQSPAPPQAPRSGERVGTVRGRPPGAVTGKAADPKDPKCGAARVAHPLGGKAGGSPAPGLGIPQASAPDPPGTPCS